MMTEHCHNDPTPVIVAKGGSEGWIRGGSGWIRVDQGCIMDISLFQAFATH